MFYRGMFAGGLRETQQTDIPVHGVTFVAMTKLLDFIYTSELELDLENVQEVLCAATLMQVSFQQPLDKSVCQMNKCNVGIHEINFIIAPKEIQAFG